MYWILPNIITGISIVYSEPVGPVVDDENVDILLKRAVPVSINSTRFMDYNILAGENILKYLYIQ